MKKSLVLFTLLLIFGITSKAQTVTFMSTACSGSLTAYLSSSVTSATSYTWSIQPATNSFTTQSGGYAYFYGPISNQMYTITCTPYNGATPLTPLSGTYNVVSGPSVTIVNSSPSNTICSGNTFTLTPVIFNSSSWPSLTYSWSPVNGTNSVIAITPTTPGGYFQYVSVTAPNGCTSVNYIYYVVTNAQPNISIYPSGTNLSLCNGSLNLSASGATSYTWSTASTATNITVTSLGCYTVSSSNSCGTSTSAVCVTQSGNYYPISITGPTLLCAGNSATLSANGPLGPNTYSVYSWAGPGIVGPTSGTAIVVSPTASACYTLIGGTGGCASTAVYCFSVVPTNFMATSPANSFTACSSGLNSIMAYGASSYTWTGPTGTFNTNSITANAVGCYTVVGSNGSGCGTNTLQVCVNAVATTPTISVTGTNSIYCPNTPVTFSATGAPAINWTAYTNNTYYNSNNASSIVVTPTTSGALCVTVTANNNGCTATSSFCGSVTASSGTLNVTGQSSMCSGNTISLTASGAQTYTWSNGATGSTILVSPTVSTCYTVSGTNACNVILTGVRCVSVFATPTVNIVGNNTVCIGGSSTFTATGSAATYTWITLPSYTSVSTGTTFVANQNTNCFVVYAFNGYCTAMSSSVCISTVAGPTLSVVSNTNSICPGTNVTLSALGSTNYTWSTGAQGSNVVVNPTASTCYTASSSANGCIGSAVMCINVVNGVPNGGTIASSVCAGSSLLLSTGGANTYVWNTSATTNTILVNPTGSQCYTATGYNTAGCSGSTVYCVNVLPAPSLTISGSNTVCLGSSVLLTASGAGVFNWSTGPTSNTISLLPSASTIVTVSSPNGNCPGFASYTVTVDTTCSNVWPGDANSDGLVSTADLLEIGLAASSTGASRSPGGNAFTSQFANNWTGTISTGKNKCHADCNGDGTVNSSDTLAVYNNITLTHAFRPAAPAADPELPLTSPQSYAYANAWNRVDINVGSNVMPTISMLGVGFELTFDNSLIVPDSIYLVYNGSLLTANSSNYTLRKVDFNTGRIFAASVRTNQQDATVSGNIASLYFKVTGLAGEEDHIVIKAENVNTLNQSKQRNNLQGGEIDLPVSRSVGMKEYHMQNAFSVSPNPAKNNLIIRSENKDLRQYRMIDLTGRIVMSGSFTSTQTLNVTELQAGVYFIEVEGSTGLARKKVIIEN